MKFTLNVDHVATLRNARGEIQPDPVTYALMAEQFGVDGIVVHLREDRRHVKERDVKLLRQMLATKLDLEMAAVDEIIDIACEVKPELVTLVPEKRQELTTEGGLNVNENLEKIKNATERFHEFGILVSLFVEPDINQINASHDINADMIEIHTGTYANLKLENERRAELQKIQDAVTHAKELGLQVNAGHGLNYNNIHDFLDVKGIDEVSIGQAVIARSVFVGLEKAVTEMRDLIKR